MKKECTFRQFDWNFKHFHYFHFNFNQFNKQFKLILYSRHNIHLSLEICELHFAFSQIYSIYLSKPINGIQFKDKSFHLQHSTIRTSFVNLIIAAAALTTCISAAFEFAMKLSKVHWLHGTFKTSNQWVIEVLQYMRACIFKCIMACVVYTVVLQNC